MNCHSLSFDVIRESAVEALQNADARIHISNSEFASRPLPKCPSSRVPSGAGGGFQKQRRDRRGRPLSAVKQIRRVSSGCGGQGQPGERSRAPLGDCGPSCPGAPLVWRAETIRAVSLPLAPVNLNRHPETDGERLRLS